MAKRIKPHGGKALSGCSSCGSQQCPNPECGAVGDDIFWRNGTRERTFLDLMEEWVVHIKRVLQRYKCKICKKSFTELPEFGLPYKRYVRQVMLDLIEAYVSEKEATYRSVVNFLGYATKDGKRDDRQPSHTRVWYWVNALDQMQGDLRRAKGLIRAKDPSSSAVGRAIRIWPKKYRSESRRKKLETAWSVTQAEQEFVRLFGISIFPEFGTRLC